MIYLLQKLDRHYPVVVHKSFWLIEKVIIFEAFWHLVQLFFFLIESLEKGGGRL
jgi:hypothetical protein